MTFVGGNPVIAVVDDDLYGRQLLVEMLEQDDYTVCQFSSGEEFLDDDGSEKDLVILDVMMPGMNGFEVCKVIKKEHGDSLPVLMLTALDDTRAKQQGIEAGCDDFLTKPVSLVELSVRVKNLLKMKYLMNRLENRKNGMDETTGKKVSPNEFIEYLYKAEDGQHKILIVDDSEIDRVLIKDYFEQSREPYQVRLAADGVDAIDILESENIDLILLDYYLPDTNGNEFYKYLIDKGKEQIPVIMITANNDSLVKVKSFEMGIEEYLVKPIDKLELLARVKSLIRSSERQKKIMGSYSLAVEKASKDSMTGLYNNRYVKDFLSGEIKDSQQKKHKLALIMLDIDDFKEYNDKHGHLKGDRVIEKIADILLDNVRESDLVARYGGEEFAIVLPQTTVKTAYIIAERIRKNVEEYPFFGQQMLSRKNLTISLGATEMEDDDCLSTLLERADNALYQAKGNKKNRTISLQVSLND